MKFHCLQCGADNNIETKSSIFECSFCKSTHFLDLDGLTRLFLITPQIRESELPVHLKKNLKYLGFEEKFSIGQISEIFVPYWKKLGRQQFIPANSEFPIEITHPPAEEKFFNPQVEEKCLPVESKPEAENLQLYYYPFFIVSIEYQNKEYRVTVDRVSGRVFSEKRPHLFRGLQKKLFIFFLLILAVFVLINSLPLPNPIILLIDILLVFYIFFFFDPWSFLKREQ